MLCVGSDIPFQRRIPLARFVPAAGRCPHMSALRTWIQSYHGNWFTIDFIVIAEIMWITVLVGEITKNEGVFYMSAHFLSEFQHAQAHFSFAGRENVTPALISLFMRRRF